MNMAAIRQGLATNLETIPDLQASPYVLSNATPPCAYVKPAEIEFHRALQNGLTNAMFDVYVFVSDASGDEGSQTNLDEYLFGPRSVRAALESDPTLGGACDDLQVVSVGEYRKYTFEGGGPYLGAKWDVMVYTSPE